MKPLNYWQNIVFLVGAVLVLGGAFFSVTGHPLAFWSFAVGAVSFSSMRCVTRYEGRNLIVRRLRRQQLTGTFFLILSALTMGVQVYRLDFYGLCRNNEWIVCLLIFCVYEGYTAFRLPAELGKEKCR